MKRRSLIVGMKDDYVRFPVFKYFTEIRFNGSVIQYEVLETLEFTSDRKRMSVVVKDCQNGKIILLSKGADEAILPYAGNAFYSIFYLS